MRRLTEVGEYGVSELIHSGELYDYVNQFDFDLPFYKKWCKSINGNVLELCCGTGRLTIPLAEDGVDITGLDISASMLERAKKKSNKISQNVDFFKGDITDFDLKKKFNSVFLPFNSFQCIYSVIDIENVFACVQSHMKDGAFFILDIFNPDIDLMVNKKNNWYLFKEFCLHNGKKVLIEEKCDYDSAGQVNRVKWKYTIDGVSKEEKLDMRCFYPLEIDALLKYNGFSILHKFGDFEENQFNAKSMKQILVCVKKKL